MARSNLIDIPKSLFDQGVGKEVKLGRSGSVFRATRKEVAAFKQKQAKAKPDPLDTPQQVRQQAEQAGKALGDPNFAKRTTFVQPKTTVGVGKSGTLQRQTPRPEVRLDGRSVQADVQKAFKGVKGADVFIPGDVGTQLIVAEVARRGGKGRRGLASAQQIAKKGGLKGFEAKRSKAGSFIGGNVLGIPNALLVPIAAAASAGAFAGGTTTTTGAGQQIVGSASELQQAGTVAGTTRFPATALQIGSGVPTTTSGAGQQIVRSEAELQQAGTLRGTTKFPATNLQGGATGSSAFKTIQRGFNAVNQISSVLGGKSGSAPVAPTGTVSIGQPTFAFQAPQVVQQRQTTTAGGVPAFVRRNRDRFGGTRTSSLFTSRGEQFQGRRNTLLGGR